jgi:hypothetical protein
MSSPARHHWHRHVPKTRGATPLAGLQPLAHTVQDLPRELRAAAVTLFSPAHQDTEPALGQRTARPSGGFVRGNKRHPPAGGSGQGGSQFAQQA